MQPLRRSGLLSFPPAPLPCSSSRLPSAGRRGLAERPRDNQGEHSVPPHLSPTSPSLSRPIPLAAVSSTRPNSRWSNVEKKRAFLTQLGLDLGFKEDEREAWYKVSAKTVSERGGAGLLRLHKNSLFYLFSAAFPDFEWDPLKFEKVPKNFWNDLSNQRSFMDRLALTLHFPKSDSQIVKVAEPTIFSGSTHSGTVFKIHGVNFYESWYKISNKIIIDNGGSRLLSQHSNSLSHLLAATYPEFDWDPLEFIQAPRNYWASMDNQRAFMDDLGKKLSIKEGDYEGWYKVSNRRIVENGGSRILDLYKDSLPNILNAVYPQVKWDLWKFPRRNAKVLKNADSVTALILAIEGKLGIKSGKDWERVSAEQLGAVGSPNLVRKMITEGDLLRALKERYPEEDLKECLLFHRRRESGE